MMGVPSISKIVLAGLVVCGAIAVGLPDRVSGQGTGPAAGPTPAAPAGTTGQAAPVVPQVTLEPGLRAVPDYRKLVADPPAPVIPSGFTSIFNGRDLSGWHVSRTARHGVTPDFRVAHGMILGTQSPLGGGGLLLSDRRYRNFELSMEVKPDWGNDSGLLFRTTDEGVAYQITLDYLPGGSMGRMIGEGGIQGTVDARPIVGSGPTPVASAPTSPPAAATSPATAAAGPASATPASAAPTDPGMAAWKREDWNLVRVRVQGDVPRATVWINGQQVSDAVDSANHAFGGIVEGRIALQIHGGTPRWQPGGFWRWRNIAIRELPTN